MKRLVLIVILQISLISVWADNMLSLSTTDGNSGEEITVSASLSLTSEVTAAEVSISLGKSLVYIDGSCSFKADRLNNHSTSVNVDGDVLKIYIYSLSMSSIKTGEGELFSFKLKCGNEPGRYLLTPTMILSDSNNNEVVASAKPAEMTIYAGKVSVPEKMDFPRAIVGEDNVATLSIRNTGNKTLEVSDIVPSSKWISVSTTQFSINAGSQKDISITVKPASKGTFQETLTIVSDAANDNVVCPISIEAIKINQISLSVTPKSQDEQAVTIDVTLDNQEDVTALEFTLDVPKGIEIAPNSCSTSTRTDGFNVHVSQIDNKCKVYLLSLTNKVIGGSSGKVMSFDLKTNIESGHYTLRLNDIKILNPLGDNISTSNESNISLNVESPKLTTWNWNKFADYVPVGEIQDAMLQIRNTGTSDLIISEILFDDSCCFIKDYFPVRISPEHTYKFRVMVKCDIVGDYRTAITILSNNPTQPEYKISLSTKIIDVNTLELSGNKQDNDQGFSMKVGMNNTVGITAVQMDIHCPEFVTTGVSNLVLSDRISKKHQYSLSRIDNGVYRIVLFSPTNDIISGNEGELFALNFDNTTTNGLSKSNFWIDNVIIGNEQGKNVCSIDEYRFYNIDYYSYSNPRSASFNFEKSITLGTGTRLKPQTGWVGEPLIVGSRDLNADFWYNPNITLGDADGDGAVSIRDITAVVSHIQGYGHTSFVAVAADVNKDGLINMEDILAIASMIISGN